MVRVRCGSEAVRDRVAKSDDGVSHLRPDLHVDVIDEIPGRTRRRECGSGGARCGVTRRDVVGLIRVEVVGGRTGSPGAEQADSKMRQRLHHYRHRIAEGFCTRCNHDGGLARKRDDLAGTGYERGTALHQANVHLIEGHRL